MRSSDWSSDVCSADLPVAIEGDAVAEKEQQDHRKDKGDEEDARIAHDLQPFLENQRPDAPRGGRPERRRAACLGFRGGRIRHAASRSARSDASTSAMKASSSVGSGRSEEHTSELQSLMRISYAVFCLKKKKK